MFSVDPVDLLVPFNEFLFIELQIPLVNRLGEWFIPLRQYQIGDTKNGWILMSRQPNQFGAG
jgi:hypothetical protein